MADTKVPINPNNPNTSLPQKGNVASLANPSTLSNLNKSESPKTFGDQLPRAGAAVVIAAASQSTLAKLYKEKANLIQEGIQLNINHQKALAEIDLKHTPKKQIKNGQTVEVPAELDDQEYQNAIAIENGGTLTTGKQVEGLYPTAQKNLQIRKDKNQKDIDDYLKDPFKKQKDALKKLKDKIKKAKTKVKKEKRQSKKINTKSILKNAKKTLVPILTLLLTNKIAEVIAQNDKIGELVDNTNNIIIKANESGDPTNLQAAQVARDNAIKIIQSNEDKINQINNQIKTISLIITIFNIIITIVSSIPLPSAVPPGIGIPVNLILKFVKILDKANQILLALSALLPIITGILDKAISILEDYKSQLLDINGQLDKTAASGLGNSFSLLSNPGNFGTISETYKGFKFAIKEETGPNSKQVGQFKRHYAVAIDASSVEVLKSEYSFTLDPDDLISQLKLLIDQQGLTTGDETSSPNGNSNSANSANPTNNPNQQLNVNGIPSSNAISSLKQAAKKPPPPIVVIGPAGSGITAKVPLGVIEKGKLIAQAAASGIDPRPKTDVAFILAADRKWQKENEAYKNSVSSNTNVKI